MILWSCRKQTLKTDGEPTAAEADSIDRASPPSPTLSLSSPPLPPIDPMSAAAAGSACSSRVASHAGSWYAEDAATLTKQFDGWLKDAGALAIDPAKTRVRAIISPSVEHKTH